VTVSSPSTCTGRLNTDGTLKTGQTPQATFTNTLGSVIIEKFGPDGSTLLKGAGFTFSPNPFPGGSGTVEVVDGSPADKSPADGIVCVDGVLNNTYSVNESTVPAGYFGDPTVKQVSVVNDICANRLNADGTLKTGQTPQATFTNMLGSIIIEKLDGSGNLLGGATFTISPDPTVGASGGSKDVTDLTGSTAPGGDQSAAAGIVCVDGVRNLGTGNSFTITEKTPPPGFFPDPNSKTVTVSSPSTCTGRLNTDGTLKTGQTPQATFTNLKGSLVIDKTGKNKGAPGGTSFVGGATFTVTPNPLTGSGSLDITDDGINDVFNTSPGVVCIDGAVDPGPGGYSIVEKTAPPAYAKSTASVAVAENISQSTCGARLAAASNDPTKVTADASFVDTPLSEITVDFTSSAGAGVTTSTIVCTASGPTLPPQSNNGSYDATGLPPGTYTCTVAIDP
jgi:hypothetical protein